MSAEIVLRMKERTDKVGNPYYFGFFDLEASLELGSVVALVFPNKGKESGALLKISPRSRREES
jgi:hypothetical protein